MLPQGHARVRSVIIGFPYAQREGLQVIRVGAEIGRDGLVLHLAAELVAQADRQQPFQGRPAAVGVDLGREVGIKLPWIEVPGLGDETMFTAERKNGIVGAVGATQVVAGHARNEMFNLQVEVPAQGEVNARLQRKGPCDRGQSCALPERNQGHAPRQRCEDSNAHCNGYCAV